MDPHVYGGFTRPVPAYKDQPYRWQRGFGVAAVVVTFGVGTYQILFADMGDYRHETAMSAVRRWIAPYKARILPLTEEDRYLLSHAAPRRPSISESMPNVKTDRVYPPQVLAYLEKLENEGGLPAEGKEVLERAKERERTGAPAPREERSSVGPGCVIM